MLYSEDFQGLLGFPSRLLSCLTTEKSLDLYVTIYNTLSGDKDIKMHHRQSLNKETSPDETLDYSENGSEYFRLLENPLRQSVRWTSDGIPRFEILS